MMGSSLYSGVRVSRNRFTMVVPFGWVLDHTISGTTLESALRDEKMRAEGAFSGSAEIDKRTLEIARARQKMQRPFQIESTKVRMRGGRKVHERVMKNTRKYENARGPLKHYLLQQVAATKGAQGILPGFYLWWPEVLDSTEIKHDVALYSQIGWYSYDFDPMNGRGAILDGECRVEAGLLARADNKIPHSLRDQLMQIPVTVEVYHGIPVERAAQHFVDLNTKAIAVDRTTEANIDPRNVWINVTKHICEEAGIELATTGRQLTAAHTALGQHLLLTHAAQMVKAMAIGGAQATRKSSDQPKAWEGVDFKQLRKAGVQWFKILLEHFEEGEGIFHSDAHVVRASPIRLALGELGKSYLAKDAQGCKAARLALVEVKWEVSQAWNGLAGVVKVHPKTNVVRLSGMSGRNYRPAYNAIVNRDSLNGRAIRGLPPKASGGQ